MEQSVTALREQDVKNDLQALRDLEDAQIQDALQQHILYMKKRAQEDALYATVLQQKDEKRFVWIVEQSGTPQHAQAKEEENSLESSGSAQEGKAGSFMLPPGLAKEYREVNGRYYLKKTNLAMFEDKGNKLSTSSVDSKTIEDMITLARAKQWETLKLSGSKEFRREAWLLAESQGIKTYGYRPSREDLSDLENLRQAKSTNSISEAKPQRTTPDTPPREQIKHPLNKNQAAIAAHAIDSVPEHLAAIRNITAIAQRPDQQLERIAFARAAFAASNMQLSDQEQAVALERFDNNLQTNPALVDALAHVSRHTDISQEHKPVNQREDGLSL